MDSLVQTLGLHETSPASVYQALGEWSLDSGSSLPATARVQSRPHQWEALLGDTFPTKVAKYGLALGVERQPYQVRRPRPLDLGPTDAAEVTRQVKSHLASGFVEVVPSESDGHLPLSPTALPWERASPVSVNHDSHWATNGKELAGRLRQTAAHCRAGRTKHVHQHRRQHQDKQNLDRLPQVLRGAPGYVHSVLLDYETQLFVVPKPHSKKLRMCQNLKNWNIDFSGSAHFKLDGAKVLAAMLRPGDHACVGDLSQAYHQCGVHPQHRRQLRFRWEGVRYQWRVLPFGIRLAPLYWTKLLRPVIAKARALGIRCLIYLDDLVVIGNSKVAAAIDWATVAGLMARQLGLLFAQDKTNFHPKQVFEALGFVWDCSSTESPRCKLPIPKVKALVRMARRLHAMASNGKAIPNRLLARYLGTLESSRLAWPWVKRVKGAASWCLTQALRRQGWEGNAQLRPVALTDLLLAAKWAASDTGALLLRPAAKVVVQFGADAAKTLQWGAWCKRQPLTLVDGRQLQEVDVETHGPFTAEEYKSSINVLEAIAQKLGLGALLPPVLQDIPLPWLPLTDLQCVCDNTTTLHSNNKQRVRTSWLQLLQANQTWDLVAQAGLDPLRWFTRHLAGVLNVRADRLSRRRFDPKGWSIAPFVAKMLQRVLRVRFLFDLFADRTNNQCNRYSSAMWDANACFVDAFSHLWAPLCPSASDGLCYAHPPYTLIPRVLQRVILEDIELVLITPVWPAQAWWPLLLSLAVDTPVLVPSSPHALLPPGAPANQQRWPGRWRLIAWHISGTASHSSAFRHQQVADSTTRTSRRSRLMRTTSHGMPSSSGSTAEDACIISEIRKGFRLCF